MSQITLYLGIDPNNYTSTNKLIHCPIIKTVPYDFRLPRIRHVFEDILDYTHFVFTSKTGVQVFFDCLAHYGYQSEVLEGKEIIAIGKATAAALEGQRSQEVQVATEETQEGIIKMLAIKNLNKAFFFLPCSSLSRPNLAHFLMIQRVRHQLCKIYETRFRKPEKIPNLDQVDEIVFTSPSTVDAFQKIFGEIPRNKKLTSIGPITGNKLKLILT